MSTPMKQSVHIDGVGPQKDEPSAKSETTPPVPPRKRGLRSSKSNIAAEANPPLPPRQAGKRASTRSNTSMRNNLLDVVPVPGKTLNQQFDSTDKEPLNIRPPKRRKVTQDSPPCTLSKVCEIFPKLGAVLHRDH